MTCSHACRWFFVRQGVTSPALLLDTLTYLTTALDSLGFTAQLAPVYTLARYVCGTLVAPPIADLQSLWHRRTADWLSRANVVAVAQNHVAAAGPLVLDEAVVKEYRQEVSVREAHKKRSEVMTTTFGMVVGLERYVAHGRW